MVCATIIPADKIAASAEAMVSDFSNVWIDIFLSYKRMEVLQKKPQVGAFQI